MIKSESPQANLEFQYRNKKKVLQKHCLPITILSITLWGDNEYVQYEGRSASIKDYIHMDILSFYGAGVALNVTW